MAGFKFRLSAVLRYRERVKEEKRWDLRSLHETRCELERRMAELEESLRSAADALSAQAGQVLTVLELRLQEEHAQKIIRRLSREQAHLETIAQKITAKREELIEADRAVKSIDLLQSRVKEEFRRKEKAEEQKIGDEVAQRKFAHQRTRKKLPS
jgi:flagellar export protein FliJ